MCRTLSTEENRERGRGTVTLQIDTPLRERLEEMYFGDPRSPYRWTSGVATHLRDESLRVLAAEEHLERVTERRSA